MSGSIDTFPSTNSHSLEIITMQPVPLLSAFSRPVRTPETEIEILTRRARQAEFERRERQKAHRRAERRARFARVLGR
jgi:hypothetical protein